MRDVARIVLQDEGHVVLEAGDSVEALELLERHGGTIDLIVTDVHLPHSSGPELATRATCAHPGLKVIYTSASGPPVVSGKSWSFLPKPFAPQELLATVRETLGTNGGSRA